jgi:uncharacterized membrane protein YdbT with pleckstrin-like domain
VVACVSIGRVAGTPKYLTEDEDVVLRTRTHAKALFWPAVALVAIGGAVGVGLAMVPARFAPVGQLLIVAVGLLLAIWLVLKPYLAWVSTTYTLTTQRLITRSGVLHRTGKDLPLIRVNDVSWDSSLTDRMFGCGTLNIQTAAENGTIVLNDVPHVQRVHAAMTELLFGGPRRSPG